jgi:hypothetical protein
VYQYFLNHFEQKIADAFQEQVSYFRIINLNFLLLYNSLKACLIWLYSYSLEYVVKVMKCSSKTVSTSGCRR